MGFPAGSGRSKSGFEHVGRVTLAERDLVINGGVASARNLHTRVWKASESNQCLSFASFVCMTLTMSCADLDLGFES